MASWGFEVYFAIWLEEEEESRNGEGNGGSGRSQISQVGVVDMDVVVEVVW